MKSNNYSKGKLGEDIAVNYLKNCGFEILDRNFAIKAAEIDIIAYKNNIENFIEVKSRTTIDFGYAHEAVDARKQNKIRLAAEVYLNQTNLIYEEISFDVVEIYFDTKNINHIIGCF